MDHLAEGDSATDTFTYTIRMANGALSTAIVTVQIAGENDKPTLASITPVSIDDTAADDTPDPETGTLVGHDVDDGAVRTYTVNDTGNNEFGSITLNATSGAYSFTADADKIDALNAGQNITVSYDAVVTDEHGAHATRSLEFTLFGAKDTAEMSGATTFNVTEDRTTEYVTVTLVGFHDLALTDVVPA